MNKLFEALSIFAQGDSLPVLGTIMFKKEHILASNMEYALCYRGSEYEHITGCYDAKKLSKAIRFFGKGYTLENFGADTLIVSKGENQIVIKGLEESESIALPSNPKRYMSGKETKYSMPVSMFIEGMEQTLSVVEPRAFSAVLTGVNVFGKQGVTTFVGTDSFALKDVRFTGGANTDGMRFILPGVLAKGIVKALKLIATGDQELEIIINESGQMVWISLGDLYEFSAILIKGQYPVYDNENIIPKITNQSYKFRSHKILEAIKFCSITYDERGAGDVVSFTHEKMKAESYHDDGFAEYLLDGERTNEKGDELIYCKAKFLELACKLRKEITFRIKYDHTAIVAEGPGNVLNSIIRIVIRPCVK